MSEQELRISKISSLLNTAIREKNSKAYQQALTMLQKCNPKPSLQEILEAQEKETKAHKASDQELKSNQSHNDRHSAALKNESEKLDLEELTLKELEAELDNLRKQDPASALREKSQEEMEQEEEKRIQEVIKRYEKTFGRIKDLGSQRSNASSVAGKSIVSSRPSKLSRASELSTVSQREAFEKLKKLEEEEEKIRKEKEDLMKFLELRSSYSKSSSRPVTVSSMASVGSMPSVSPSVEQNFGRKKKLEPIEEKHEEKIKKIPKVREPIRPKDEVAELLKNLY